MLSTYGSLYLLSLLALSVPLEKLAQRLHLPVSGCLVVLGFAGTELIVLLGVDTGIRWNNFHFAIFYLFLPALIFQAALQIDLRLLRENLLLILILALPLSLISTGIIAAVLYYGIGFPSGFPWLAALLAGALLAATDPAAVLSLPETTNISRKLRTILEGESLFNDVTVILLFSILIGVALDPQGEHGALSLLYRFFKACVGGILVGAVIGICASGLSRHNHEPYAFGTLTLASAYSSFLIAEKLFSVSGVMAVLITGLMSRRFLQHQLKEEAWEFGRRCWDFYGHLLGNLIFILAGITVTLAMFNDRWIAMLLGIGGVLLARLIIISALLGPLSRICGMQALSSHQQTILNLGSTRGVITLALALALPLQLDYWYTIQSIAYGVVIFTLFVQTPGVGWIAKRWRN